MHVIFIAVDHDFITTSNQTEYTVRLGDNVSLVCGFNLTSRTDIDFIWMSPTGMNIKHHDSDYSIEKGPDVVRHNITNATVMDDGLWNCTASTLIDQQPLNTVLLQIHLTVLGE